MMITTFIPFCFGSLDRFPSSVRPNVYCRSLLFFDRTRAHTPVLYNASVSLVWTFQQQFKGKWHFVKAVKVQQYSTHPINHPIGVKNTYPRIHSCHHVWSSLLWPDRLDLPHLGLYHQRTHQIVPWHHESDVAFLDHSSALPLHSVVDLLARE